MNFANRRLDPPLYFWRDATGHEVRTVPPMIVSQASRRRLRSWKLQLDAR